jgi:hypothetical protein
MYREYGHGAILKEPGSGKVVGTVFEMSMNTADKTSFTHRLAIDASYEGKNLGYHLMMYSCLLAMEKVSMIKRGIIQIGNLRSLHINLNKVGWVADGFEHISTLGDFVRIAIPLNLRGLTSNVIDQEKLMQFIHTHQEGKDYRMVPAMDVEAIQSLFQLPERYKIVSMLKADTYRPEPMFLAVPNAFMQA